MKATWIPCGSRRRTRLRLDGPNGWKAGKWLIARTRKTRCTHDEDTHRVRDLPFQERYGNHEGFVDAVHAATVRSVARRVLLQEDADKILAIARESDVLVP